MGEKNIIHIVGGGLAGAEAAWQAANLGVKVVLHEMRPVQKTEVHQTELLAELVCSNSFRSDDATSNAVGVLHAEMRLANSLIMREADASKVPAGSALAVDREQFSSGISQAIEAHQNITVIREAVDELPEEDWENTIIATGPLTSANLANSIKTITGEDELAFFDAIAPIIYKDSINFDVVWYQSRYDKVGPEGTGADYINCPLDESQYAHFIDALTSAEKMEFRDWERSTPYFEGCLPIEVMAERGRDTLRFGPMKPVGIVDPKTNSSPYAVVQLRQDNKLGTLYNMVGFQTKLKHAAQVDIFRLIPGLEQSEFARLGGIHRNTFLNSPSLLDESLRLKARPSIRFAGQITGVEGYLESAAIGLLAGIFAAKTGKRENITLPPPTSALGALLKHITSGHFTAPEKSQKSFQPMNINFGLFPEIDTPKVDGNGKRIKGRARKIAKKQALARRAISETQDWLNRN